MNINIKTIPEHAAHYSVYQREFPSSSEIIRSITDQLIKRMAQYYISPPDI